MFAKITWPIYVPYVMYRLYKSATPEQKAALKSKTTTDEEKNEIAEQIARTAFPSLV
jgi:hypothetical protein